MPPDLPPLAASLAGLDGEPGAELVRLARLGYRHVQWSAMRPGLRPRDLDAVTLRALRATLRRAELAVSGIDLWIPPAHFFDDANCERALAAVTATIALSGELDRVPVQLVLPAPSDERKELPGIVEAILRDAERRGVALVDCAVPPSAHAVTHAERLRVGIDPPAWLALGRDPVAAVSANAARLGGARLCDLTISGMRAPIADSTSGAAAEEAQLDALAYGVALAVAGLTSPVVVDARQWADPWGGFARTREVWDRATG